MTLKQIELDDRLYNIPTDWQKYSVMNQKGVKLVVIPIKDLIRVIE